MHEQDGVTVGTRIKYRGFKYKVVALYPLTNTVDLMDERGRTQQVAMWEAELLLDHNNRRR